MAVTLNFNLVCMKSLNLDFVLRNLNSNKIDVSVDKISCIDNWMWVNQQEIQDFLKIEEKLNDDKIAVINLKSSVFKDMGIYIEKINGEYAYDLWINTEGFSCLDSDVINAENEEYYKKIYKIFGSILKDQNIKYKILAIGVETTFNFKQNIVDMIHCSDNVVTWIINKNLGRNIALPNYKKKLIDDLDAIVFEK